MIMKLNKTLLTFIIIFSLIISCKKNNETINELQILRESTNSKSYPAIQMDSLQAVNSITKQKVQELIDLSALYLDGNQDTHIDKAIFKQMEEYFYQPDSLTFKNIFEDFKLNNVKSAKVKNLELFEDIKSGDTLNMAKFSVEYFDKSNRYLGDFERKAQYTMTPNKENKEFKFYFLTFYEGLEKDSTSLGVIRKSRAISPE